MSVETNAKFITEFNEGYPRKNDLLKEGDDHMRLIKAVLKNTLPGFNRTVNMTSEKLNQLDALTAPTSDTLKVTGNIEVASKKTVNMGDNVVSGISDPIEDTDAVNLQFMKESGVGFAWPINSIYISVDPKNPKEIFGFGEWEAFATGRVLISTGSDKDANEEAKLIALNAKGGTYNEKLVIDNLPAHKHGGEGFKVEVAEGGEHRHEMKTYSEAMSIHDIMGRRFREGGTHTDFTETGGKHTHTGTVTGESDETGKDTPHNNMMPYFGVHMWKRTK